MKKLIVLVLVLISLFAVEANACAVPVAPVIVVVAGGGTSCGIAVILTPMLADVAFAPYFWMFYKHPECRDKQSIGEMSECVQFGTKK